MENAFHIHISSIQSQNHYPRNKWDDFTVDLGEYIQLTDKYDWECSLEDITCQLKGKSKSQNILVECDLCDVSHVYGRNFALLRKIKNGRALSRSMFIPIRRKTFQNIHFHLLSHTFSKLNIEYTRCSLYFRPIIHQYESRNLHTQS